MFEQDAQAKNLAAKERVIDAALDALPVYPAPPGLKQRVMVQVRQLEVESRQAARTQVRYQLDFLDFALPVFFAIFGMLVLSALLASISLLDPSWLLRMQASLHALVWRLPVTPEGLLLFILAAGLGTLVLALLVVFLYLAPVRLETKNGPRIAAVKNTARI
jgi:hypothetical protein